MYTLLVGAKKDAGDFLIVERAKRLLEIQANEKSFLEINLWESLDDKLDSINKTKAIILCGGPGYTKYFYPNTFPLTKDINAIKVPIIPFALGWDGVPMYHPDKFSFSKSSRYVLQRIHESCKATSCRDNITKEILNRYGFKNVIMTGCTGWYEIGSIGKKFERPKEIRRVAVSMAFGTQYVKQNAELLKEVKNLLEPLYPRVELYALFHRGIEPDRFTPESEAKALRSKRTCAKELGYRAIDASYGTSAMKLYRQCDFHVGYRVHAHIFCLSIRKPTFLLQVDGRGRALSETLGLSDVPAATKQSMSVRLGNIRHSLPFDYSPFPRYLDRIGLVSRLYRMTTSNPNSTAVKAVINRIQGELMNGFSGFEHLHTTLDNYYQEMVRFLKTLP